MENSPFAMDPNVLENNLFVNQSSKKGKSQLCTNYLPHLFHFVKTCLSESERNSLKDYEVQVLIIETAIGQRKFSDLNVLADFIIKEVRADIRYWIKGTDPFMKVYEDLRALGANDEKLDSVIHSMKEENENAFKEFREYHDRLATLNEEIVEKETKDKKIVYEEIIEPAIAAYIPKGIDFKNETYEKAVDNYYSNKNESYSKKIRTRWQDRRDRKLMNCPQETVKNYVSIFKEMRDNDPNFANSIFVCNRSFKMPRIEIQLFPVIFQFLGKRHQLSTDIKTSEQVFLFQRLQNLIYLCLMTDDKTHASQNRVYKGAFIENNDTLKNGHEIDKEDEPEEEEEEKRELEDEEAMVAEDATGDEFIAVEDAVSDILSEFKQFSLQNGIDVDALFGNHRDSRQRKFSLLNNTLRICRIFIEKIGKWELAIIPTLEVQDATFDNFKIRELITRLDDAFEYYSDSILETIIDYYHLEFEHKNIYQYIEGLLQYRSFSLKTVPQSEKEEMQGVFSDKKFCAISIDNYQNYFNSPTVAKKRSYIFHTSHRRKFNQDECKKFLEGLHKFYDTPVNNKKIAKHIGPHIKANHIRFIKGNYLRLLRKKAKAGNIPIRDLLKTDIDTNNIKEVRESL